MPIGLQEHLENLLTEGVEFDPYVEDSACPSGLLHAGGTRPVRSAARERRWLEIYWDKLDQSHRRRVAHIASLLPPMEEVCRLVVQVPARFEAKYLKRFLRLFLAQRNYDWQPLPPESYEVLVVNNYLAGEQPDESEEVVACVKKELGNRARNIHIVSVEFEPEERYPLTLSRRYAADITVCRLLARRIYEHPVYFALEDADLVWLDPRQIALQVQALDAAPSLDAVRGQQDRCPWILCENDLLLLLRRSWNFTEAYLARKSLRPERNPGYDFNWNRIVTSGWNTVVTAESFARINGYTPHRRMGEDVDLGERISCIRGRFLATGFLPQMGSIARLSTRSEGSPRRWLLRVANRVEPYERTNQYQNFFSPEILARLRHCSYTDLLEQAGATAKIGANNLDLFEEVLSKDFQFTLRVRKLRQRAEEQFRFVMTMLGFKRGDWHFDDDRIGILRTDGISEVLEHYRACHRGKEPCLLHPRFPGRRITWRSFAT